MRYSRWLLSAAIAAVIILLLSTCDLFSVGLGSKVDLNPPTVKIIEPVDNSYVSGVVTLRGTVEDDIGVQSVRITIEIDGTVFRSVDAIIEGNTWTAELDTTATADGSVSSRVLDGSRVISAIATDKSGKSLTDRVNVNFDTSAPTVLVSVPQAAETDKYNTKIVFRGTVYDPSPLNKVDVVIYGPDGAEKYRETSKNTASWTVTVDQNDIDLDNGTYSYAVYASDRAGNTNGHIYHSEDMAALFGSTISEEDIGPMDQGEADASLPGGFTAAQLEASRRYPPNADPAHSARADFIIDMNTDKPTFSVSVPSDSLSAAENVVGSGASVIGVVEDDKGLDMNTLVATITPQSGGDSIAFNISLQGTQGNLAYSVNFPLKSGGLVAGTVIPDGTYDLVLSVKDLNGLEASTNPIGFTIDGSVPIIGSVTPDNGYIAVDTPVQVSVSVSDDNGIQGVMIGLDGEALAAATLATGTVNSGTWTANVSVPSAEYTSSVSVRVEATDTTGKTARLVVPYNIDSESPVAEIISPDLSVSQNGIIQLKGATRDNTNSIASLSITVNGVSQPVAELFAWSVNVDTRSFTDGTTVPIQVVAMDNAGNSTTLDRQLIIEQVSDVPVLTLFNLDDSNSSESFGISRNQMATSPVIRGSIADDDGIAAVDMDIALYRNETALPVEDLIIGGTPKLRTFSFTVPVDVGKYRLVISVNDDISAKFGAAVATDSTTVWFAVDKLAPATPVLAGSSDLQDASSYGSPGSRLILNVSDDLGIDMVIVTQSKDDGGAYEIYSRSNLNTPTYTLDAITAPALQNLPYNEVDDGVYQYLITVTDYAGKSTTLARQLIIDTTAPVINIGNPGAGEWIRGTSMGITGGVSEARGIASVSWSIDGTNWNATNGTSSWNATVPIDSLTEGSGKSLMIKALDLAGNISERSVSFGIDQADPTTSVTAPSGATAVFTIGGTALDGNAISSVVVTQIKDGAPASQVEAYRLESIQSSGTPKSHTWTSGNLPVGGVSTGTYTYTVTVTDLAGNPRTYADAATVAIDLTPPETIITDPSVNPASLFGNSYEIRGTASDTGPSGIARVDYRVRNNQTTIWSAWTSASGTASWSKLFTLTGGSGLGEGSFILEAKAYDGAGNADPTPAVLDFYIDQNLPTISSVNGVGSFSTINGSRYTATGFGLTMTAADTNALAGYTLRQKRGAAGEWKDIATDSVLTGTSQTWTVSDLPRNPASLADQDLTDGLYTYVLSVKDAATRVSETSTWTVTFDAADPGASILTPGANEIVSTASITTTGTATDGEGSGVSSVYYTLGTGDPDALLNGTTNWNGSIVLGAEGAKTLKVRAMDFYGNYSSVETVSFNLDLTPPTLAETAVGTDPQRRRSVDFLLSGTAYDTNGLRTWDDPSSGQGGIDGVLVPYIEITVDTGTPTKVTVNSDQTWTFPYIVPADHSKDGDHTFTITATDVVNKPTTITRLVTVDSTKPVITIDGVVSGLNTTTNKVNGQIGFRFGAADTGVGIEKNGGGLYVAYYTVVANNALVAPTSAELAAWTVITSASSNFSFTYNTAMIDLEAPGGYDGDGPYDLYIGIRDAVTGGTNIPNFQTAKYDLEVDQTSDYPVITIDNLEETALTNDVNGLGQNPSILVTVADDDFVDVSTLLYRIDINNDGDFEDTLDFWNGTQLTPDLDTLDKWENEAVWYAFDEIPTSDKSLAQAKILLANFPQGVFRIQLTVTDTVAGAYSTTLSPIVRFSVDYGPPTISVTSPLSGTYNSNLTLSGTATDALGVISVKYSFDNGLTYTTLYDNVTGATNVPISTSMDISAISTGEYTLQIVATDKGGYTATQQIPITIDKTVPTITFLNPAASDTLNGTVVTVSGEAQDNRLVGAVFLWHGLVADSDPALPSRTAPDTYTNGEYVKLVGKGVWNATIDTTAQTATATNAYRIRVVAIDDIGNVGIPVDRPVTIDQASDRPSIDFSNLDLLTPSRLGTGARIIGTTSDDDGVDKTYLQIRIDYNGDGDYSDGANEAWKWVSNRPTANSLVVSWYHTVFPVGIAETQGKKHVQVRALDINTTVSNKSVFDNFLLSDDLGTPLAGYTWKESSSVEFFIDYGPPTLTLTAPSSGTKFNVNQFTITGTTNDGNGVDRVVLWTDDDGDQIQDPGEAIVIGWMDANLDGLRSAGEIGPLNGTAATGPISIDDSVYAINQLVSGLTDGVKAVQVTSYDTADAASVRDFTVVIDTTAPSASFNTPAAGVTVNGTITVSGLASDNYQLANILYSVKPLGTTPVYPADYTALNQTYSWSFSLVTSGLLPGSNVIHILPIDSAQNYPKSGADPAPYTRTIIVNQESDRPLIQVTSINETGTALLNLLPGDKIITGTVQDDEGVNAGSIQVRILSSDGLSVVQDWTTVTGPPTGNSTFVVWNHVLALGDGVYRIRVRAYDTNSTAASYDSAYAQYGYDDRFEVFIKDNGGVPNANDDDGVIFAIDTANPVIEVTGPAQNYFSNAEIPFSGTASDGSDIKTLTVAYRLQGVTDYTALAVTGTTSWSASLSVAALADGVYDWRVTATDNFDKSSITDRIFTLDRTKPEISISNPGVDSIVNGSLYIDGSATDKWKTSEDGFQITSVRVWMGAWTSGGTVEPVPPAVTAFHAKADTGNPIHDSSNWKELNGTNSWNYRFNSTVPVVSGTYSVFVAAFDNSGNVSTITKRRIYIDQTTNLPSVSLTTLLPGYLTGTADSATTTSFTDDFLSGSGVVSGWYVRFRTTGAIRKVTGLTGSTVSFTPMLSAVPAGVYDLLPNMLGFPSAAEGEVSDDDGVDDTTIQIAVDANGDGVFSGVAEDFLNVDSKTVSGGKIIFSHNIGSRYNQGLSVYRLKVRASDTGEPAYSVAPVTRTTDEYVFVRDDAAPASATLSSFGNGVETRTTGIVGSNFKDYLHLEGVATDSVGVGNVEVAIGLAANFLSGIPIDFASATVTGRDTASATWSFTNAAVGALQGEMAVRVRVTDVVGKQTIESFTFNVDRTGPVSTFESPAAATLANGSLYISGSAQDTYRISKVYLWIQDSSNPTPALPSAAASNGWLLATGTSAWNYRFNTTARVNGAKTVHVVSIDNTGNVGAEQTLTVTFDQGLNRPILAVPGLRSSSVIGMMEISGTTAFTDSALKGNLDVQVGWLATFPDATEKIVSAFDSGTGQVSWTGALASAFPVGSSYTLEAPWYTVTGHVDDSLTVSALSNANRGSTPAPVAGSVAMIEVSTGVYVTYLVSAFDGATGTLTLVSAPAGVTNGSTRVKVLPKTLLGLGASLSGTVSDDDGVNTGTIQFSIDLNNDGDYADTVGGQSEAYQNMASVSGSGNAVSFSNSLATLVQGTTVYKLRLIASDVGEAVFSIDAVTRESSEYLVAKDDAVPNDSALLSFSNGFYGASLAVPAKDSNIAGSYIANGKAITLTGSASDTVGVAAVDLSLDGGTNWLPASGTIAWTWTHTFAGLVDGDNVPVLVRTTDYWGRTASTQFSFKADSELPTATFPAFGRKLNGLETLQGTSNDLNSGVHAVYFNKTIADTNADGTPDTFTAFSLADPNANGWTVAGVTGTTSWNTSCDTVATSNTAVDKNVRIAVTAVDEAGNFYSFERVETINQDSDRPVISFSNIGMTSSASVNRFDANPKIIGAAIDDDGVDMAKVLVSLDGSAYVLVTNPPSANGNAGTTVTWSHELTDLTSTVPAGATATALTDAALINQRQIVAGSWQLVLTIAGSTVLRDVATFNSATGVLTYASTGTAPSNPDSYTLRLKEGLHTVSVRVGDMGSGADSIRTNSYRWEQSDGNTAASWQDDPTDLTYDTGAPVIALTRLQMVDRYAGAYLPLTPKTWDLTDENLMSAVVLNNDWTLSGTALDGSLATVTVQVDSGTVSGNIATGSTWTYDFDWRSSPPVGFLQGSHTVKVTATDSFGKSTVKTLPVIFDSAEPASTLSSPASTSLVFNSSVNGIVYMNGSLGEASVVGIDVGLAGRASYYATYTTPTAVANWTYNFNSGTMLTDPGAPDFKRTFARIAGDTDDDGVKDGGETWTGDTNNNGIEDGTEIFAYISNIRITATDTAGNVTRETYTFTIDNSTDRPTASFTLPADGSYRSGDVLVSGLSSDDNQADDGVYNVWVQLDVNGDGLFTGNWEFPGGATAGAGNDPYENEALWYKVPDAQLINGAAWSLSINGNGTLYSAAAPAKTPSLTAVTIAAGQLYATETGFSGMIKMRTVAVDNHGTVGVPSAPRTIFLDESYPSVSGILINGTAHTPGVATLANAIVRLSTLFSDDQNLGTAKLEVKYNTAAFAAIASNALAGPYDWNGDGINEIHAIKKAGSTAIGGTSGSTLATSLTATALDGLAFVPGMVLHTGSGSRVITGFVDGVGSGTVSWTGDLVLSATEPFIVVEPFEIDTSSATAIGGTVYQDNEGVLNVTFRVTDETNQASQTTVELAVDNKRPSGIFNHNDSLTYIGTDRTSGLYSFSGNDGTANLLVGNISDTGIINGIRQVGVYFVKDMNSDGLYDAGDKFWSPRLNQTSTAIGSTVSMYATGSVSTSSVPYPVDVDYIIKVDKRTENLVYDTDPDNDFGDDDDFQESLLTKAGYDEWKVYFDTARLPDGPIWIFAVYEDDAGNRSYQRIEAQISNNPPSIGSVVVGSSTINASNDRAKVSGTVGFTINATDAEGVKVANFKLSVTKKYLVGSGGIIGTEQAFTPFYYGDQAIYGATGFKAAFTTLTPATGSAITTSALVNINTNTADFPSGYWYKFQAQAVDTDGNTITRDFFVWVNNTDDSAPIITFTNPAQTAIATATGHLDAWTESLNDGASSVNAGSLNANVWYTILSLGTTDFTTIGAATNAVGVSFKATGAGSGTGTATIADADLSGLVTLSGTVYDDTSIASVTLQISYNAGVDWTDLPNPVTSFGMPISGDAINGYTYNWSYPLNTADAALITGSAGLNLVLRAKAQDGKPNYGYAAKPVDVVPYITDITTGLDSGSAVYIKRSALGRYPISSGGANFTIRGFNFGPSSTVTIGNVAVTVASRVGTTSLTITNNLTTSGAVVVTTNTSVLSRNNSNDNTLTQNKEAKTFNPNLTDDRYISVWQLTSNSTIPNVTEATMRPGIPRDGKFNWMYVKNGAELRYYRKGTPNTEYWITKGQALSGGDFVYNSSGTMTFLFNNNEQWTSIDDSWNFTGSMQWGALPLTGTLGLTASSAAFPANAEAYNWNLSATGNFPRLGLGNTSFVNDSAEGATDGPFWYTYGTKAINRYSNAKLRVLGTNATNYNYAAYFDSATESRSIVFYAFSSGTAPVASARNVFRGTTATATTIAIGGDGTTAWKANLDKFNGDLTGTVAFAGTQKNNKMGIYTPRGRWNMTSGSADSAHFDLQVYDTGTAHYGYLAYYDSSGSGALKIIANTNLKVADPIPATGTTTPTAMGSWTSPEIVDTGAGAYVSMVIDPAGGIHLAYQDGASGYLKYAYLTFDGTDFSTPAPVTVDALLSSGQYNSITIRNFSSTGTDYRPVITTYSSVFSGSPTALRMVYPVNALSAGSFGSGADPETGTFNGNWESIAVRAFTSPLTANTFIDTTATTPGGYGKPHIGYNGSYPEEAELLDLNL